MDLNKAEKRQRIEKLTLLHDSLRRMDRVAVAYSGGIDSSFLLHSACEALGKGNIVALHAVSSLAGDVQRENAQRVFEQAFSGRAEYYEVQVDPLSWPDFTANADNRCYLCKSRLYRMFIDEMTSLRCHFLLDGTNRDDLGQIRPGLRAIRELGVRTPLADAGLSKREIRLSAKEANLPNYASPANSCLATRVATGTVIRRELLERIEKAENFLEKLGFSGTRVRPFRGFVLIDLLSEDVERFCLLKNREVIQDFFNDCQLGSAFIHIVGR